GAFACSQEEFHVRRATPGGTRQADQGPSRVQAALSAPQGAGQESARCGTWRAPDRRNHPFADEAREARREGPPDPSLRRAQTLTFLEVTGGGGHPRRSPPPVSCPPTAGDAAVAGRCDNPVFPGRTRPA